MFPVVAVDVEGVLEGGEGSGRQWLEGTNSSRR